jgi:uncharacterized protein YndB with AHSA1/START domain
MADTRDVAATRQRVWDVLADGSTNSGWVVGNSRIRAREFELACAWFAHLHSIGWVANGDQ